MTTYHNHNLNIKVHSYLLSLVAISLLLPPNINSVCIVLYTGYVLFSFKLKSLIVNFKKNIWFVLLLSSFYIINLISYFYSENTEIALFDYQIKLSLLVFPVLLLSIPKVDKLSIEKIQNSFSIASLVFTIALIIYGFITQQKLLFNQELSMQFNIHASYLSLYLSLGFFIMLNKAIEQHFKFYYLFLLVAYVIILGILASRSIFISTVVLSIVWLLTSKIIQRKIKIIFLSFVAIFILSLSFLEPVKTRFKEAINFSDKIELDASPHEYKTLNRAFGGRAIRVAIWECSKDIIKKDWLFGVGAGDSQNELQKSYKNHAFEFAWRYNSFNAHNLFLQSLISCGILGLISVIILISFLLINAIKTKNRIFISFIIIFLLLSFVESTFNVHKGVVFFSFFSSLFVNHFLVRE